MSSYYTPDSTRLEKRLTDAGVKLVANRNKDATTTAQEKIDTLDEARRWAANRIDAAVMGQIEPSMARGQQPDVLGDVETDLAAAYVAGFGGRDVPETLSKASDDANSLLQRFEAGARVPGLHYPQPINTNFIHRIPRWGG